MPTFNPDIHRRKSLRLKHYDYRQQGFYFITICCHDRMCLFGKIEQGYLILNEFGNKAVEYWQAIPDFYPQVRLHDFIIMPNHVHGIIEITYTVQGECNSPLHTQPKGTSQTIGAMVRGFKSAVTSWARNHTPYYQVWQRNYHEHIIRNENAYLQISEYIKNNPLLWQDDCFYVE